MSSVVVLLLGATHKIELQLILTLVLYLKLKMFFCFLSFLLIINYWICQFIDKIEDDKGEHDKGRNNKYYK